MLSLFVYIVNKLASFRQIFTLYVVIYKYMNNKHQAVKFMEPISLFLFSHFLAPNQQNPRDFWNVICSLEVVAMVALWSWNGRFHDSSSHRLAYLFNELLHLFLICFHLPCTTGSNKKVKIV